LLQPSTAMNDPMSRIKITTASVKRLTRGARVYDTELSGFGVRLQSTHSVFFVRYRIDGKQKQFTVGKFGPLTVEQARKQAAKILAQVALGQDPAGERSAAKAIPTVEEASADFLTQHVAKLRPITRREYARHFEKVINPVLGSHRVSKVTHAQVSAWHAALSDRPRTANLALAVFRKFFAWAAQQGHRAKGDNPCAEISQYPEVKRERYLHEVELQRLGVALADCEEGGTLTTQAIAAIRLLIFTGCRLSEILNLKWQHVDTARGRLLLSDSKTGSKAVILNAPALAVLEGQPRLANSPWVLPSPVDPAKPLHNLQKPWRTVRSLAGLDDVRLHDLRHSFASVAAQRGASLPMIGRLLGHTQVQTTARYAHLADATVELLNEQVGEHLAQALAAREER